CLRRSVPATQVRPMRLPATLYAERIEGYIRYRLEVPEHDVGLPLQQEFSHVLDEATVLALRQSADALLRCEETARFPDEARGRSSWAPAPAATFPSSTPRSSASVRRSNASPTSVASAGNWRASTRSRHTCARALT